MTMYLSGTNLRQIFYYLLGGFEGSSWLQLVLTTPIILAATIAILLRARALNGFLLGEEAAAHLGVDVRRERAILLGLASLITAAAVSIAGLIGFVGLVVPHVVRLVVGPNARLGPAALRIDRGQPAGRRRPRRPARRGDPRRGRDRDHRRPVLPRPPPPDPLGIRAVKPGPAAGDDPRPPERGARRGRRRVSRPDASCATSRSRIAAGRAGRDHRSERRRQVEPAPGPGRDPPPDEPAGAPGRRADRAARPDGDRPAPGGRAPGRGAAVRGPGRGGRRARPAAARGPVPRAPAGRPGRDRRAIDRVGVGGLLGRDARELSLGERQLVLLALAVAQAAPILVLDEPTVHLDLRHQVETMELLVDLNERDGTTVLAVLHDLGLAGHFFPRLVLLAGGRIVADGQPDDVLADDRIRTVFGVDPAFVRRSPGSAGRDRSPPGGGSSALTVR